jgi:hypothetical protein
MYQASFGSADFRTDFHQSEYRKQTHLVSEKVDPAPPRRIRE